jgi:ABC-2 type transport system permease protein
LSAATSAVASVAGFHRRRPSFAGAVRSEMLKVRRQANGNFTPISSLSQTAWKDTWMDLLVCLISVGVCILLASATSAVGRSLAFGVGAAMAFFPADNFAVIVMALLQRITHQTLWADLTQWLLGPTLNYLPQALQPDHSAGSAFFPPLVGNLSATHCLLVIGAYAAVFTAASAALTWRRDVLA